MHAVGRTETILSKRGSLSAQSSRKSLEQWFKILNLQKGTGVRKRNARLDISFMLCGNMKKRRLEYEVSEKMNILTAKMRIVQDIDDRGKVSILVFAFAAP